MPKSATSSSATRDVARTQVLRAARQCFRRDGVRTTTMEDIARVAGVSRQTVYKVFANRLDLINAAVAERISELADAILAQDWSGDDLTDAFISRAAGVVTRIRADNELRGLLGEDSPVTLHQALWQPAVKARGLQDWQSWLRSARKAGLVRSDVTDADIYEWIQTVLTSLILHPDSNPEHQRTMIEVFLVDSLAPRSTRAPLDSP